MYVVKFNGEKVRPFNDRLSASAFARNHCKGGKIEIVELTECRELPKACGRMYPNEDLGKLVYKPFISVAL